MGFSKVWEHLLIFSVCIHYLLSQKSYKWKVKKRGERGDCDQDPLHTCMKKQNVLEERSLNHLQTKKPFTKQREKCDLQNCTVSVVLYI